MACRIHANIKNKNLQTYPNTIAPVTFAIFPRDKKEMKTSIQHDSVKHSE